MRRVSPYVRAAVLASLAAVPLACKRNAAGTPGGAPLGSPSGGAAAGLSSVQQASGAVPPLAAEVNSAVNPANLPPYAGPTGTVEGVVSVKGDPPASLYEKLPPAQCSEAVAVYRRSFRASPDGALADALVAVTGYDAFVPAVEEAKEVRIHGCAFDRRTVALTMGQRLDVKNVDPTEAFLPHLTGARAPALMVAVPKGDAVKMYPPRPGRYLLADDMGHGWMKADVFVLQFPTHDVSDVNGTFRVARVPVGRVEVHVMHPAVPQAADRTVEVKANETVHVDFELTYEAAADAKPSTSSK